MREIAPGDWVIYEHYGCHFGFEAGFVLYVDKNFVVVQHGGLAFDVSHGIRFVGNREQVREHLTNINNMQEVQRQAIKAAQDRVTEITDQHRLVMSAYFKTLKGK